MNYFQLFQSVVIIPGYRQACIYDLQLGDLRTINKSFYHVVKRLEKKSIEEVCDYYGEENTTTINAYLEFLLKNNYGVIVNKEEKKLFPKLSYKWNNASQITNCSIEISETSSKYFDRIIKLIQKIRCKSILLIISTNNTKTIDCFVKLLDNTIVTNVYIYCQVKTELEEYFKKLIESNFRITKFEPFNDEIICSHRHGPDYFICNMDFFCESLKYNNCLNRKIHIKQSGDISNCMYSQDVFGNLDQQNLDVNILTDNFRTNWIVSKDKIDVCRNCEFRYACTDCRVFLKESKISNSQPLRCKYNPYISKWEGEDGYVPVEKCVQYSSDKSLKIKYKYIHKINSGIWTN